MRENLGMKRRKTKGGLLLLAFAALAQAAAAAAPSTPEAPGKTPPPVRTVERVDLSRYLGRWYEIAAIPQRFQKDCTGGTTAEYAPAEDGRLRVVNSCDTAKGRKVTEGRAKVVEGSANARLKVTFVKLLGWVWAFGGDYWVIDLAADYRYAVVGHPGRGYGWILSRAPAVAPEDLRDIAARLTAQGYDTCRFLTTPQEGGLGERTALCRLGAGPLG
jgi:apolipoprotein D and lipocalin family protein